MVVGDIVYDLLVEMREPLAVGSDTRARIHARPGGAGANQAAWLARLGVQTHLVSRVGDDPFGRHLVEGLERDGVIAHVVADPAHPTGTIVILVDAAGERTMIADRGANLGIAPGDLPAGLFRPGAHLHLSGYSFFEPGPRAVAGAAMDLARRTGMTISVDPASVALLRDVGPRRFLAWTRGVDLCFPNLEEGALLGGLEEGALLGDLENGALPGRDLWPNMIVEGLSASYAHVALKMGADGAMYGGREQETAYCRTDAVTAVDTTGAGDAFCAAFLSAWLDHHPPAEALRRGVELAAQVVRTIGAR